MGSAFHVYKIIIPSVKCNLIRRVCHDPSIETDRTPVDCRGKERDDEVFSDLEAEPY